jgi:hypothetical protein
MDIIYLVTHAIMALCSFSIIRSSFDLSSRDATPKKDRAVVPVVKKAPAKVKTDFKVRILNGTPSAFKPDNNQKLLATSLGFRYDIKRLI